MNRSIASLLLVCLAAGGIIGCSDGGSDSAVRIDDWNFVAGKYFFLTDPDSSSIPGDLQTVRVFLDDRQAWNDVALGALPGEAWLDPDLMTPGQPISGTFHLLSETDDYEIIVPAPRKLPPIVVLHDPTIWTWTLAVAYSYTDGESTHTVGTLQWDGAHPLQLKVLRPSDDQWQFDSRQDLRFSPWAPARRLELRNVYDLGLRHIDPDRLTVNVFLDPAFPTAPNPDYLENEFGQVTPLIQVLGLDQKNNVNPLDRTPDGRVDPEYVDYENGLLFFPDLRPFDPGLADIAGTSYRERSWPVPAGEARPDTLGWTVGSGQPQPSAADVRSREVVPEIYDLLPRYLRLTGADHHKYTIEARVVSGVFALE